MFTIKLDADRALSGLTDLQQRQIPFAMANAINRTAEEVQTADRDHISQVFTIRRPWVLTNVRIARSDFATKTKMSATIAIPDDSVLSKFEGGGMKAPRAGRSIAIPVNARRTKSDIIAASARPRAFGFVQSAKPAPNGGALFVGKGRTFMIQMPDGTGWIFKRTGKARKGSPLVGSQLLYVLKPKAVIPNLLGFYSISEATAQRRFPINMQGMLEYALKTAK